MKESLIQVLAHNLDIIIATATTLMFSFIKKKLDIKKMKKEGRLVDKPIYRNGTHGHSN